MILAISKNSCELWISSPRREEKWFPCSRAVIARWRYPATFINHSPRRAHTEPGTHGVDACILWDPEYCGRWKYFAVHLIGIFKCGASTLICKLDEICMRHTAWRYVNVSGVCRALQAFCSAHRWLQWAFVNAHCVNKTTRQAQQMLHEWGSGFGKEPPPPQKKNLELSTLSFSSLWRLSSHWISSMARALHLNEQNSKMAVAISNFLNIDLSLWFWSKHLAGSSAWTETEQSPFLPLV